MRNAWPSLAPLSVLLLAASSPDRSLGVKVTRPAGIADRLGAYNWNTAVPSNELLGGADLVASLGSRTIRVVLKTTDDVYAKRAYASLVDAATHTAALFADPRFSTFLLTTYSDDDHAHAFTHWSPELAVREAREFSALAAYLGKSYPEKRFILLNWEGDNEIAGSGAWDGMVDWMNTRAAAVRGAGYPNVRTGLELNLLRTRETGASCDGGAAPCVVTKVAPRVDTDYYSYSSYQSINVPDEGALASQLTDDLQAILDHVRKVRPSVGPENLIIGECGFARESWGECATARRAAAAVGAALSFGVSYVVYWQIADDMLRGKPDGFGAFRYDAAGTPQLTLVGRTLGAALGGGELRAAVGVTCPAVDTAAVSAGSVTVSGTGWRSSDAITVHFEAETKPPTHLQAPGVARSDATVTAAFPTTLPSGQATRIYLTVAAGNMAVDSNGVVIAAP